MSTSLKFHALPPILKKLFADKNKPQVKNSHIRVFSLFLSVA